jgi:hypothetical protein
MTSIAKPQEQYPEVLLALQLAWQPIATAPKDGSEIFIYLGAPYSRVEKVRWYEPFSNWQDGEFPGKDDEFCGIGDEVPTHWMPVPLAPDYFALPAAPHGRRIVAHPDGSRMTIITEYEQSLENMLAEVRDLFPAPASGELHQLWAEACSDPAAVPAYVKASYAVLFARNTDASQVAKVPNETTLAAMREADEIIARRKKD